jgi:polyisoprenyl-phosphate glycosyltransferase
MTTTLHQPVRKEKPLISCVIPVYNESANLSQLIKKIDDTVIQCSPHYELVFVDDGSTDDSAALIASMINDYPIRLLQFSRNFGKEQAITAGLEHAHGDIIILMDADGQHPTRMIPKFFDHWQQGYDMVYGIRQNRNEESFLKRSGTHLFYKLLHLTSKTPIEENAGDFRLMDRRFVDALRTLPERNRFMKGLYSWVGFKTVGLPFTVNKRHKGKSSFSIIKLVHLATTGITSFTTLPLHIWLFFGAIISLSSILFGTYILFETLYYGADLPGWATLVVLFTFLNGITLLSIGILGKYIANIYSEVKLRPCYIIGHRIDYDKIPTRK